MKNLILTLFLTSLFSISSFSQLVYDWGKDATTGTILYTSTWNIHVDTYGFYDFGYGADNNTSFMVEADEDYNIRLFRQVIELEDYDSTVNFTIHTTDMAHCAVQLYGGVTTDSWVTIESKPNEDTITFSFNNEFEFTYYMISFFGTSLSNESFSIDYIRIDTTKNGILSTPIYEHKETKVPYTINDNVLTCSESFQVYNLNGQLVFNGQEYAVLERGIYIVIINEEKYKIVI